MKKSYIFFMYALCIVTLEAKIMKAKGDTFEAPASVPESGASTGGATGAPSAAEIATTDTGPKRSYVSSSDPIITGEYSSPSVLSSITSSITQALQSIAGITQAVVQSIAKAATAVRVSIMGDRIASQGVDTNIAAQKAAVLERDMETGDSKQLASDYASIGINESISTFLGDVAQKVEVSTDASGGTASGSGATIDVSAIGTATPPAALEDAGTAPQVPSADSGASTHIDDSTSSGFASKASSDSASNTNASTTSLSPINVDGNVYKILQVRSDATLDQITQAYNELVSEYNSSKSSDPTAAAKLKSIGDAYQILSNPQTRAQYDQTLFRQELADFIVGPKTTVISKLPPTLDPKDTDTIVALFTKTLTEPALANAWGPLGSAILGMDRSAIQQVRTIEQAQNMVDILSIQRDILQAALKNSYSDLAKNPKLLEGINACLTRCFLPTVTEGNFAHIASLVQPLIDTAYRSSKVYLAALFVPGTK